jgi:hypothetical protein
MNSFYGDSMISNVGGERVKVALRVRPMMPHEMSRGDDSIVNVADNQHALLNLKTGSKSFRFNAVLDETTKQSDVFNGCGVHVILPAMTKPCVIGIDRLCPRGLLSDHLRLRLDRLR